MSEKHDAMWGEAGEEIASLRAEIARLRVEADDLSRSLNASVAELDELTAENAKLLAALQEITNLCKREPANPFLADDMDRIAIAALAGTR